MQKRKTKKYSLADLEGALRACDDAIVRMRRGYGGPVFTLAELKSDAEALATLVAKARVEPNQSLSYLDIGELLPRLVYWKQRDTGTPPASPQVDITKGGSTSPIPTMIGK